MQVPSEVDADEEVIVACTQRAGQVRILQGVQQLRLVHMAAQGACATRLLPRAHTARRGRGCANGTVAGPSAQTTPGCPCICGGDGPHSETEQAEEGGRHRPERQRVLRQVLRP